MVTYYKLFDLLNRREIKTKELLKIISYPTLGKLKENKTITTETIEKICLFLGVQPNSIMEIYQEINGKKIKWDLEQSSTIYEMNDNEKTIIDEEKSKIIERSLKKTENGYYIIDTDKYFKELKKEINN